MSIKSQNEIKANIQSELADNNAGLISAYDVRHNMEDIVDSINSIVASGDFDVTTPFVGSNVRAKILNNQYGCFVAESGIIFPNGGGLQTSAFPGISGLQHNNLAGLTAGDPHTQYLALIGSRVMQDNLGMGSNWINSSGNSTVVNSDNRGLQFVHVSGSAENINVGSQTQFVFGDNSTLGTSNGAAKAWINFDASGVSGLPTVRESYNVKELQKVGVGKFKIVFTSGILKSNNYVAIGSSNSRGTADNAEDFDLNTVGMVAREGDDASTLRSLTFCVLNDGNQFIDAQLNEIVVFGLGKNVSSGTPPSVVVL